MATTYPSKIGRELVIPLGVLLGGMIVFMIYAKVWLGLVILGFVSLFIVHLFTTTFYQIEGDRLRIKSGFFYNETINIHAIKQIVATNSMLSSPALSLDRLEIKYHTFDSVLVSPKEKLKFVEDLQRVNPGIQINLPKQFGYFLHYQ